MEHIPSSMTNFKTILKNVQNEVPLPALRTATLFYIIYFAFTSSAFAQEALAPTQETPERLATVDPVPFSETEVVEAISSSEVITEEIINFDLEDTRAKKIKAYYDRYNLPLADSAESFVKYADQYGLDWRLVAAIGFIESTGGKHACSSVTYSPFGWGSCKINFSSYDEAIQVVSKNLGGHNPKTAHYYAGKDLTGILYAYNSVIPNYKDKILKQMETIDSQEVK